MTGSGIPADNPDPAAVQAAARLPAGSFTWKPDPELMSWSAGLYRLYGFEPGQIVPTPALLLSHQHPRDRPAVLALLESAAVAGDPFALYHRMITARGRERRILTVGEGDTHGAGGVEVRGFSADLTGLLRQETKRITAEDLSRARENMAEIEQAKGALRVLHGTGADEAFQLLVRASNDQNKKLLQVAREILDNIPGPGPGPAA